MSRHSERKFRPRGSAFGAWGWALVLALAVLASLYVWLKRPGAAALDGPPERVVIATNTDYVGSCPVIASLERGFFAEQGLQVVVQPHTSGKAAMEAVLQGKAHLGTAADTAIMFAGLNDKPVAVIASIFKTDKDHGVVGRRDKGVVVPASLKGKRIGVTLNTSGHFTLDAILNRQLLRPADVSMRNYKPEEMAAALEQGEVDAVASWEPFLAQIQAQQGSNAVAFYGEDVYESIYNITAMRNYVASRPETMQRVVRALVRGAAFCDGQPEAARALMGAVTRGDQSKWQAAWPTYRFSVVLDQGLVLALEDQARWAIKNKMTGRTDIPNYLDYVYLDALEAIMPSAVTIIH